MEQGFRNLDHRMERIDQSLPTLATKDDLQAALSQKLDENHCELRGDLAGSTGG